MKPTILIIDDDTEVTKLLKLFLDSEFEVQVSNDPGTSLERISQTKFDLILTDLNMTELSGISILQHAQKCQFETPVVIMSGTVNEDLSQMSKSGVAAVLVKPFESPRSVVDLVKKSLLRAREGSKG